MSRSVLHSNPTAAIVRGGDPATHTDNHIPVNSRELETWKLTTRRPFAEALAKGNFRFHVDEAQYRDANGNYRCVVKLEVIDEAGHEFDASGVLIGPSLVLTSAHNVRYHGGQTYVSRVVAVIAYIGYHLRESSKGVGVEERFGRRVIVLRAWERSEFAWHNDMAVIKLESRFTQVEPASYHAPSLEKSKVLVVGYPGENTTQVRGSCPLCKRAGCMYEVTGQAEYNAENLLEYRLSTMPGNSGSPVFLDSIPKEHARRTVIATHSCGNSDSGINYAAPVDVAFIEACKAFLIQSHPTSHRYIVMQRQDNTSSWYISRTEGSWHSHVSASRPSKLHHATPILSRTERQRSQAKVIEQNSSSEEDEVEEGFVVLPSEPSHDVPSAQNYTGPWKWLRKRR